MNELIKKSAGELAKLIQTKEVSSREIVQAHLDRINEVNPDINAVTVVLEESALALSDQADNAVKMKETDLFTEFRSRLKKMLI